MTPEDKSVLFRSALFRGLEEAEGEALLGCLSPRRREYKKGEALWLTGDAVTECAVVLSGRVRAETVSAGGERSVTALHGPGGVVGDVLMATPGARSPVDVFAGLDTAVVFLPFERIMGGCGRACGRHVRLRENLLSEITAKFWTLRQRIGYLSLRSLRGRIAARLLDEAARTGADTFSLGGTREELADLLGVNRSALSRELGRMRAQGLIDCYRDSFRILDQEALDREALGRYLSAGKGG